MKKMKKTNWYFLDHISLVSPLPDCYLPWVRARTHACTRLACTGQACGASTSVQSQEKYNTTAVKAPLELENEILELDLKYGKGIFHLTWQVVLRGHFEVLVSLPFQKYKHVGPICNKAVFVYLCIYMPWVKAIDH